MEEFGSKKISNSTATPYSDATQTKKQPRNKIKRPMNAFMVWSQMQRRKLASTGSTHHAEVSKRLGMQWKSMSDDAKKPYFEESARLQQLHLQEFPDYKYQPKKKQTGRRASVDISKVSGSSKQIRRRRKSSLSMSISTTKNANVRPQLLSQYSPDSPVSDITDTLDSDYILSACDVERGNRVPRVSRTSESSSVFSFERIQSPDMMTPAATPSPCPSPVGIWCSGASPAQSETPVSYQASPKTPSNTGMLNFYQNTPNTFDNFSNIPENVKIELNISSQPSASTFTCLDSSFYNQNSPLDPAVQEIKVEDATQFDEIKVEDATQFDEVSPINDSIESLMATINSQMNEEQFEALRNVICSTDLGTLNSFESVNSSPTIPTEPVPTAQVVETSYFRRTERQNDPFLTSAFL